MDDLPIGRYGTIHYMSNNGSEVPLASYPVDEPVINLGRSDHNTCHIRLFDRWCSDIHCKLIFDEGKAFLVVLGENGVVIDGSTFTPSQNETSPTTVPLTNGSEWLISNRRFIFQYPPKDQRAKLMATPQRKSRKSLRMSMINAAQLWTPSAPKTQEESWQRLKSPMQPFPGEKGGEITVVEGDPVHLSHNQEEIIVVESMDSPAAPETEVAPSASVRKPPQTPSRRGPANLHKQVLLMNSHRKHTKSISEMEEEREVEESILVEDNFDEEAELEEDAASNPFIGKTPSRAERVVSVKQEEPQSSLDGSSLTAKSFRASLGAIGSILPFGRPSGVVHSPNPPVETREELLNDQEMDQGDEPEQIAADTRPLGPFFTPQASREYKSHPRQSMGSASYMDLDNDIEQARRRLASLATAERPQMADVAEERQTTSQPVARSVKKSRASLPAVPELSSPLPLSKGRFSMAPMATIHEPPSLATPKKIDEENEDEDTSDRLQRLMRTVEKETRRESIRESRRSVANPVAFYAPTDRSSPTKGEHKALQPASSEVSTEAHQPAFPNIFKRSTNHSSSRAEPEEESDTSAKDSEINAKPKRSGKAPSKQSAPVTGKRTAHAVETSDDQMQVDEPTIHSDDAQMEDVEERPAKKAKTTRKAKTPETLPAPRARRTKKAVTTMEDENADEESASVEESTSVIASRSRRGLRAESATPTVEPHSGPAKNAPSTSTRRVGKPKAVATAPDVESAEEDPAGSTASGIEPTASRTKGRRGKTAVAAKAVIKEEASESIQEDGNDEMDIVPAPKKVPARRAARGKAAQQAEAVGEDSEQASEEASPVPAKAAPKKAPARGKAKAVAAGEGSMDADSEPVSAPSKAKPAARTARKAAAKEEEVDDAEATLEAKPRRTTRTKR